MKRIKTAVLAFFLCLTGCGRSDAGSTNTYEQITQEKAKQMMDSMETVILDVRELHEFEAGHIPNAVLLPVGTITAETAQSAIPHKDSVVLVYCRSGNRSKKASEALCKLGYTQVYEFGGITTWPFEIE